MIMTLKFQRVIKNMKSGSGKFISENVRWNGTVENLSWVSSAS